MDINRRQKQRPAPAGRRSSALRAARVAAQLPEPDLPKRPSTALPERPKLPAVAYTPPAHPKKLVRRKASKKMLFLRGFSVVFALFLATGGFLTWRGYAEFHKVFRGTTTVAALAKDTVDPNQLKGEGDGRVNILLMGVGGPGHDGADLTDTMLILSVDPVNNTAALVSIPRDLWVKMPTNFFGSYQKINAAYESGKYSYLGRVDSSNQNVAALQAGFTSVDQTVESVIGINIQYHVLVNFQAFRQAIDTVGGVTVDVKTPLVDPTMAWENGNNPVLAAAGVQQMNGVKALQYSRSRETTSDFARTERQRQVLVALKDKMLAPGTIVNPAKLDGLLGAFGDNVYSDLSTGGAQRLFSIMKKVDDAKIQSIGLSTAPNNLVTTDRVGNASVVRPLAGFNNYTAIQTFVRSQLPDGYITKEHAGVQVMTATPAAGQSITAELKSYGYQVGLSPVTLPAGSASTVTLIDLSSGSAPYTKHYLERRLGLSAVTTLPAGIAKPAGAKFVILETK